MLLYVILCSLFVICTADNNEAIIERHNTVAKSHPARNCKEILSLSNSSATTGHYVIHPFVWAPQKGLKVLCDMDTEGGGWTVIQRRDLVDCHINFNRSRNEYVTGFGNDEGSEFWVGLDVINGLTSQRLTELRVDMWDTDDEYKFAKYRFFHVADARDEYRLEVEQFSGTANDSLIYQNTAFFSTWDHDVDQHPGNCAVLYRGGWWYRKCHESNLNGFYYKDGVTSTYADGIVWYYWKGFYYSLKKVEMKIRPVF